MPVSSSKEWFGSAKEWLQTVGLKDAIAYLDSNPERNIPKILHWIEVFDRRKMFANQIEATKRVLTDKSSNWYQLVMSLYTDIDPGVRKKVFENFLIYGNFIGWQRQKENRKKYDCNIPWAILMDPTTACNLKCTGCWAADYGHKMSLEYDTLADIIRQGQELGVFIYIFSGGEPLIRKDDILKLCREFSDCIFLAFTNGTLIDDAFTDAMLEVKNFVPAISIEGFESATDSRRGKGTYQRVINAMQLLKSKKLLYGVSCCYTRNNTEVIGSEEFFDYIIDLGAKFAWFFTYMPVGVDATPDLIATAEQREFMYHQIRKFRSTKPIFTLDFWNDGEYVNGCIAGGRRYLHINANGDIEPCAFIHYADSNIHQKTILEALQSPLFTQYKERQPFNENHLRPCPLLDNPPALAEMVEAAGAYSTEMLSPENVRTLCGKCVNAAEEWSKVADRLWTDHIVVNK